MLLKIVNSTRVTSVLRRPGSLGQSVARNETIAEHFLSDVLNASVVETQSRSIDGPWDQPLKEQGSSEGSAHLYENGAGEGPFVRSRAHAPRIDTTAPMRSTTGINPSRSCAPRDRLADVLGVRSEASHSQPNATSAAPRPPRRTIAQSLPVANRRYGLASRFNPQRKVVGVYRRATPLVQQPSTAIERRLDLFLVDRPPPLEALLVASVGATVIDGEPLDLTNDAQECCHELPAFRRSRHATVSPMSTRLGDPHI